MAAFVLLAWLDPASDWSWAAVAVLSALKFMVGVALGVVLRLPFWAQLLTTALGGLAGVVGYTLLGAWIRAWIRRWVQRRVEPGPPPRSPRPWVLWVWKHLGLPGLAVITPPLLGPPVGIPLALALGAPRQRILVYVGASVVMWAVVFAVFSDSPWLQRLLPG